MSKWNISRGTHTLIEMEMGIKWWYDWEALRRVPTQWVPKCREQWGLLGGEASRVAGKELTSASAGAVLVLVGLLLMHYMSYCSINFLATFLASCANQKFLPSYYCLLHRVNTSFATHFNTTYISIDVLLDYITYT